MDVSALLQYYAFHYYGIDWAGMLTGFACISLLANHKRSGFLLGMVSACFGIIFSLIVGSMANAIASVVVLGLYFRGYGKWSREDVISAAARYATQEKSV